MVMQRDIFLFDRSVSPPQAVAIPGANDALTNEVSCVLDGPGTYLGFFNNNTSVFSLYNLTTKALCRSRPARSSTTAPCSVLLTHRRRRHRRPAAAPLRMSRSRWRGGSG
jgi:hypothetical protein